MMAEIPPIRGTGSKPKHAVLAEILAREIRGMPPGASIMAVTALWPLLEPSTTSSW
jgi:hypothetical protein